MDVKSFVRPACDASSAVIKQMVTPFVIQSILSLFSNEITYFILFAVGIVQNGEYPTQ